MVKTVLLCVACLTTGAVSGGLYVQKGWERIYCETREDGARWVAREACMNPPGEPPAQCTNRLELLVKEDAYLCAKSQR